MWHGQSYSFSGNAAVSTGGPFVILGLGSAGARHLNILKELGIENLGVVRSGLGPTPRPTPNWVHEFHSLREALAEKPEAVIIATPTAFHFGQAAECLSSSIPVFVEKPLATTYAQACELALLAKKNESLLYVGYHLRHDPLVRWIDDLLTSQSLGRPMLLRATWGEYLPDWHPGEDYRKSYAALADQGGGPLLTLSHVLDYVVGFMGPVERAGFESRSLSNLEIQTPDTVTLNLTHSHGGLSLVELDFWTRPKRHELELRLEQGALSVDFTGGSLEVRLVDASKETLPPPPRPITRDECFTIQMLDFLSALKLNGSRELEHELAVMQVLDERAWRS